MDIIYEKAAHFDEEMKSGLMREKFGEIQIEGEHLERPMITLKQHSDFLIWRSDDEEDSNSFEITLSDHYSFEQNQAIIKRILEMMKNYQDEVQTVRIFRSCEVDRLRVEEFLISLNNGDVFENIMENVSKLCFIDSGTYLSSSHITQMIDKLERILFEEIVNRKIRVNGKEGVLKEVNGNYERYGFFKRGVRKNYVGLSLVQKMGTKTIRELNILQ